MCTRLLIVVLAAAAAFAQEERVADKPAPVAPAQKAAGKVSSKYVLATDDSVIIHATDVEDISDRAIRIDPKGDLRLPLLGKVHAAGLTIDQLELELLKRLQEYVKEPSVTVTISEFRSQPVFILGSVSQPGAHQLQGEKSLFEVLSLAGGLRPDAGYSVKVTRKAEWGKLPLPDAAMDPSGEFSVGSVSVKAIMEARSPEQNIAIKPNDVISVPKGEMVYVIGSVKRSGGFVLGEKENVTVLQALSLAEGFDVRAAPKNAKILRMEKPSDSARTEIPVDLRLIMEGKAKDVPMHSDDILFVPSSVTKSATIRGLEAVLQIGTGYAIYRR